MRHTFLRDSLYIDFLPLMAGADGVIRGRPGTGGVAAVSRDDIASGELEVVTGDVAAVAGHPPMRLAEFLDRNPDS